tara:strand:- start:151 stop:1470 length:1320 start_codon:yes stop_codon:yes gene_type:complete
MQSIKNDISRLNKQGKSREEIKTFITKKNPTMQESSIDRAIEEETGVQYEVVQKIMRSDLITNMNDKGSTIYLCDPFCAEIKKIEYSNLKYLFDRKTINNLSIRPCEFVYDPFKREKIFENGDLITYFNTYEPPKWMVDEYGQYLEYVEKVDIIPKRYEKFFKHLTDNKKSEYDYILKWLANAIQNRNFCVLSAIGAPGIGKGVLGEIMVGLVGSSNFCKTDNRLIRKDFNSQFKDKRLVFCDEINIKKTDHMNKFKDLINQRIEIEGKGENAINSENFASIYIASNNMDSLFVPENDRRFSIIELTSKRLDAVFNSQEIDELISEENVNKLAAYLYHLEINQDEMLKVHRSSRTEEIRRSSLSDAQEWFIEDYAVDKAGQEIEVAIVQDAFREKEYKAPSRREFERLEERFGTIFSVKHRLCSGKRVRKIKFYEVKNG